MTVKAKATSKVPPHGFERDADVPRDLQRNAYCARCGLPGEPGDDRHPAGSLPLAPSLPLVPDDVREQDARILGERGAAA